MSLVAVTCRRKIGSSSKKCNVSSCCNMQKKGSLGAAPPGKFLIEFLLLWHIMHLPISCLPLALKTLENSVVSFLI